MEELIPITLFVVIGLTIVLRGPLGRALGERLAGRAAPGGSSAEFEALRQDVRTVMEDVQYRLTEMEERLDFAERLLAQQRQREELPGE